MMKPNACVLLGLICSTTCSLVHGQYETEIQVAKDGTADFAAIQEAIDSAKSFPDKRVTVHVKNGIYEEKVKVHSWNSRLTLQGESTDGVIIRWNDHFDKMKRGRNSTFHTATLLVDGDECCLENLTIENTAGPVGQAVALSVEADRCLIENCRLVGHQDTLYAAGTNSRQHYRNCHIEGTTDFVFGEATAYFENCTLHSKANSYITAASTPAGRPHGFVFDNCRLTAADGVKDVFLGRPWRSFAKTVFIHCEMDGHIHPAGWSNWNAPENETTAYYAEGHNTGPGADAAKRVPWAKMLSDEQAKQLTGEEVLKPFPLPAMQTSGNDVSDTRIPKDPSYTLASAYAKYKKDYPFIRAVEYDSSHGNLRQSNVCYHTVGTRKLSLDIFSADPTTGIKPAVLLVHGGGWSSGDRKLMHPLADYLSRHGFVAITVEYRLSPEARYPAAVDDLKNAVTWVLVNGQGHHIDTNKVAILGCSAGAQLAGLVGLTYRVDASVAGGQNPIRAIVNIDGVMDFTSEEVRKSEDDPSRESTPASRWLGGRYAERPERWKEASPLYYVDEQSPPIKFVNSSQPRFHAGRDEVIAKLNEYSIDSAVTTFDDAPHSFWLFDPWFEKTGMVVVRFLQKVLN
ncbi:MAG: pectinesterase family protein [Pirellulaceae bacterium]